ncbi:3-deoxy-7-phosphoheptulonate synthase [Synechococcus sp. H70.2]|uniref:3-deoxy-7-phosphoheptulonate synthase n=2 Tax=unclassified Synechococcus TaxID=2626047 RepID=UPI0039C45AC4
MPPQTDNCNIQEVTPLITPAAVKAKLPLTERAAQVVLSTRQAIRDIIHGRDLHRLVVIVGPCSIHDPEAALEYAHRLKRVADRTREHLVIVMRTYFEKPRTTVGWKGLINDPHLDGSCDIATGLQLARSILLQINELGLPCATEMLDPVTPQYTADLVSWAAIGARTIESQTHREMASGLSMPVGFKNGTDGRLEIALNAILSASHPHSFLGIGQDGRTALVKTTGNPDRHIVLRGGGGKTNYGPEDVARAALLMKDQGIPRSVMVDCSHDNSHKDYRQQGAVCRAVLRQYQEGQRALMGLMLESNLKPGKQTWQKGVPLQYGVSITDGCIGWEETEELLQEMAATVAGKALALSH